MISGKFLAKIWAVAGSRNFTVFVLVMSITYALILAVFGLLVEHHWLDIMTVLYPFQLLYVLFFLNLILVGSRWLPLVIARCKRAGLPDARSSVADLKQGAEVQLAGFRVADLKQFLRRRGYQVRSADSAGVPVDDAPPGVGLFYASKGHFSLIGNLLFHASFVLLLLGAVANGLYSFRGTAAIAEGQPFTGSKKEYQRIDTSSEVALPNVDFDVKKIEADFWQGRLFFTRLEAQLVHRGGLDTVRLSSSARVGDAAVTIAGFGYVPLAVLKGKDGSVYDKVNVDLNIFLPGSEDHFQMPGYPHKIHVSFYPDYAVVDGKNVSRSMDPVNPAYALRVMRGRLLVYTGVVKPGEWAEFDGLGVSFPSFRRTGDFQIVRNPGNPMIWSAFILMGLGLAWRLFFYRKEVALWQDEVGRHWLSGRADYYPALHGAWLDCLAGDFKEERR